MKRAEPCPCGTGAPYLACCAPLHRGEREAADAPSLMRSRYAAFAKGEAEYLWRTLHPDHADRAAPRDLVLASIRESARTHRYMGLTIHETRAPDAAGIARVLFVAKVFRAGRACSFAECSDFARDAEGWRYLRGLAHPLGRLPPNLAGLDLEAFCALPG